MNELAVVFVSIVLQSIPFVLVGAFASALVQRHLSAATVARWMPRRVLPAVLVGCLFGFVAPVCDCGVIPVARRLAAKGLPLHATVAFILAAPVLNPVVLLSTAFAFQGNWWVVALRMAMTFSVAATVGLLAYAFFASARRHEPALAPIAGGSRDAPTGRPAAARTLAGEVSAEYFDVMFFIVLGAFFTAVTQTFVPRGNLSAIGADPLGSVAALMPLATLLSLCSEADAFVARAFATTFSLGAVLAFMTIGQVVDLRNGLLLVRTLGGRLVLTIVAVSYVVVFAEAALINQLVPGT